ncbi:MAG: copper resistance protein CopC [Candidatus Saccharibacteria bacterium]|nr:copper resistance protein CopC [Candidatus Saccharibacteria bacterium]
MYNVNKKHIILAILVLSALLLIFGIKIYLDNQRFQVFSTTPSLTQTVATSTSVIKLDFNKPLSDDSSYNRTLIKDLDELAYIHDVERAGDSLLVRLGTLNSGQEYTVTFNDIISADGDVISDLSYTFFVDYIPYDRLSEAQKALELQETDRGSEDDPVLNYVPHSTLRYEINPIQRTNNDGVYSLGLDIKIILSNADRSNQDAAIATYKEMAMDYLRSVDINPDDYDIYYRIIEPTL